MDDVIRNHWNRHNAEIKEYLRGTDQDDFCDYDKLLKVTLQKLFPVHEYSHPDPEKIARVDFGDYQGTLVFVVGSYGYQPDVSDHWVTSVSYGSCSGCDTLQAICDYTDGKPSKTQVDEYWTLCLHMMQKMKRLTD